MLWAAQRRRRHRRSARSAARRRTEPRGTGRDKFRYELEADRGDVDGGGQDLIVDFARSWDRLDLELERDGRDLGFGALDTNGDGRLGAGDRGFAVAQVSFAGTTEASLVIDTGLLTGAGTGHSLTLLGVTSLAPVDLVLG